MPYVVGENFSGSLLDRPESGMGYQCVRRLDETAHLVILNAELGLCADEDYHVDLKEIEQLKALYRPADGVSEIREPQTTSYWDEFEMLDWDSSEFFVESHGSYISSSFTNEKFVRYSAYNNDRRILNNGSVLPGTYATTDNDASIVPSGLAAVARYALPNSMPAVCRFNLVPPKPVPITCGTVAPAFGQAGGGIEVCFSQGAPQGTSLRPAMIPER